MESPQNEQYEDALRFEVKDKFCFRCTYVPGHKDRVQLRIKAGDLDLSTVLRDVNIDELEECFSALKKQ